MFPLIAKKTQLIENRGLNTLKYVYYYINHQALNIMAKIKNHYKNILLIDNDRMFIVNYHKIFSSIMKYANIEFSMSTTTALDKLHDMHKKGDFPELITLDWRLKLGGGAYFLEQFDQLYSTLYPETKVLIMSEMKQETEVNKALDYPFVKAVLPKPVTVRDLSSVL